MSAPPSGEGLWKQKRRWDRLSQLKPSIPRGDSCLSEAVNGRPQLVPPGCEMSKCVALKGRWVIEGIMEGPLWPVRPSCGIHLPQYSDERSCYSALLFSCKNQPDCLFLFLNFLDQAKCSSLVLQNSLIINLRFRVTTEGN